MENRGRGSRGDGWGNNRTPPVSDQQAFIESIGAATAIPAQTCAMVSRGESSNLQRFEANHPPAFGGGGDSMVRTAMAIEKEANDTRNIWEQGVGKGKRKENQSSSSISGKKQRTLASHEFQGQDHDYQGQVRSGLLGRQGRWHAIIAIILDIRGGIALRGKDPGIMGHLSPSHQQDVQKQW